MTITKAYKSPPKIVRPEEKMVDFVTTNGWKYIGNCGCHNAMNKYSHIDEKYKNHEIWINKQQTRFEVRRKADKHSRLVAHGNAITYQYIYSKSLSQ